MTSKKAKLTLGTLLVTAIVLASPSEAWGTEKPRVIAIENKCGLEVKVPHKSIDLGNLNPGDSKQSSIQVSNKGTNDITLFIRTNILDETTLNGGYLADIMDYTIKIKKDIIAEDTFRAVVGQENILIGTLKPGTSKRIDLATFLPGKETGNQYQGAYMKVSWTFVTQCSSPQGDINNGGNDKDREVIVHDPNIPEDNGQIPLEEIIIEDELVPLGQEDPKIPDDLEIPRDKEVTDNPEITIEDEKVPFGDFKMPKTGQLASFYFYGAGTTLILFGVFGKEK